MPKAFLSTVKYLFTKVKYLYYESVHTKESLVAFSISLGLEGKALYVISISSAFDCFREGIKIEEHSKEWVEEQSSIESLGIL